MRITVEMRANKAIDWMEVERCQIMKANVDEKMLHKMVVWAS